MYVHSPVRLGPGQARSPNVDSLNHLIGSTGWVTSAALIHRSFNSRCVINCHQSLQRFASTNCSLHMHCLYRPGECKSVDDTCILMSICKCLSLYEDHIIRVQGSTHLPQSITGTIVVTVETSKLHHAIFQTTRIPPNIFVTCTTVGL